jgi:hypothetical protein
LALLVELGADLIVEGRSTWRRDGKNGSVSWYAAATD